MNGLTFLGNTGDPANFSMLIDEDGDGDFTTGTPTVVAAQSIANGRLQFNNVLFNNGVVFTLPPR